MGWLTNLRLNVPFPYFKDKWYPKKMISDLWNSSKNKKALLEPKDANQGLHWEGIFRTKIFRSSIYLGRDTVPEDLIFDLGLGEEDLRYQSNTGNDR